MKCPSCGFQQGRKPAYWSAKAQIPENTVVSQETIDKAHTGDKEAIGKLLSLLRHNEPSVTVKVSRILFDIGEPAIGPLTAALEEGDARTQILISSVLSRFGQFWRRDEFIHNLSDPSPAIRRQAAAALGKIKSKHSVEPLIQCLNDEDKGVRSVVLDALCAMHEDCVVEPIMQYYHRIDGEGSKLRCIEALGRIKTPGAIRALVRLVTSKNMNIQRKATETLIAIGSAADPVLRDVMRTSDNTSQKLSIQAIRNRISGEKQHVIPSTNIQTNIPSSSRLSSQSEPSPLSIQAKGKQKARKRPKDHYYKFNLTNLVNEHGYDVVQPLIKELGSPNAHRRRFATDTILQIGRPAKDDLIQALADKNPRVRQNSARILGMIGDASAQQPLTRLLQDPDVNVRHAASEALTQLS